MSNLKQKEPRKDLYLVINRVKLFGSNIITFVSVGALLNDSFQCFPPTQCWPLTLTHPDPLALWIKSLKFEVQNYIFLHIGTNLNMSFENYPEFSGYCYLFYKIQSLNYYTCQHWGLKMLSGWRVKWKWAMTTLAQAVTAPLARGECPSQCAGLRKGDRKGKKN